jgi:thioredoxin reductase
MITEVLVIGGGAAGVTAAVVAAEAGCKVTVIDAGNNLGGQYFRHSELSNQHPSGWKDFQLWQKRFLAQHSLITYLSRTTVWSVSHDGEGFIARATKGERDKQPLQIRAQRLVIATGAHDRPLPYAGWQRPGNFTLGAVQSLIKANGVLAGDSIIVAGTGPFLLATAASIIDAGGKVAAVVEANSVSGLSRYPRALWVGRGKLIMALKYLWKLRTNHVPVLSQARVVGIEESEGRVSGVTIQTVNGEKKIACDTLATGYGFMVNLEVAVNLGLELRQTVDRTAVVAVKESQQTSHPYVFAAGETTGVAGVDCALIEGQIAGAAVAQSFGKESINTSELKKSRAQLHEFAEFLMRGYPIHDEWIGELTDNTIVCRCEEVTAGDLRHAIDELGAMDARSAKLFTRAGMGWCQGRMCSRTTSDFINCALGTQTSLQELEGAAKRVIINPIPLEAVANWDELS